MSIGADPTTVDFDLAIVGGGLVGASLALALRGSGLRIIVLEGAAVMPAGSLESQDERTLALGFGSRRILGTLGLWPSLRDTATPIRRIHVSNRGHFGGVQLDAAAEGVEALGYVLSMRALGKVLVEALRALPQVEFLCPAQAQAVQLGERAVSLHYDFAAERRSCTARLLVAADGGDSRVRKLLGVGTDIRDYQQSAVSANVRPQSPHRGVAFERFTDSGPLALLPFDTLCCTAIWTHSNTVAEELARLPDTEFLRRMQEAFGYRLGRFLEVGRRSVFPLHLVQAREQVHGRSVLIGNAAHTLHPVAGQGFNLGLRDAASLAGILAEVARLGGDPGAQATLQRYRHARRWDQGLVVRATDSLARLFVHDSGVLDAACALGMKALDLLPPLKHGFARYAMGLSAR